MADLERRLKEWQAAGLITAEQAEAIAAFEAQAERRRVSLRNLLIYLGAFFILTGLCLTVANLDIAGLWKAMPPWGRMLVVAAPTIILWIAGALLRRPDSPIWTRGAQACWMAAAWMTALAIAVVLFEWPSPGTPPDRPELGRFAPPPEPPPEPKDPRWIALVASLGALPPAVLALLLLPGLAQGLPVATLITAAALSLSTLVFDPQMWGAQRLALYLPWAAAGVIHLTAAEAARRRRAGDPVWLFNLFGAWSWLLPAFLMGLDDHQPFWETLLLLQSLALIGWSVIRPSRVLLYSGAFFLLVYLIDINFEYFAGRIGLPAALLITGIAFMAVGLGVRRLRRRLGTASGSSRDDGTRPANPPSSSAA
jgi:hypothetical protein